MPTRQNANATKFEIHHPPQVEEDKSSIKYVPGLLNSIHLRRDDPFPSEFIHKDLKTVKSQTSRRLQSWDAPAASPAGGGVAATAGTGGAAPQEDVLAYAQQLMAGGGSDAQVAELINSIPHDERAGFMSALAIAGGDTSQIGTYLNTLPKEDREAVSAALMAAAFVGSNTARYKSVNERAIKEVSNEIVYDNWAVNWGRDFTDRETRVKVGNDRGYVGVGTNLDSRAVDVSTGFDKTHVYYYGDETDIEYAAGVWHGQYGVYVSRDFDERQTSVETMARGVETGTIVDFADREYGQRIKVRDFEISVKHDFDDTQDSYYGDDDELATEVVVGYKSTRVAIGADVNDTEYAVSVGTLGRQVSVLRDFDERETDIQANWGDGYQLVLNGDMPDDKSDEIFGQVGFGKIGKLYAQVGAGVGDDGIPQGAAEIETADVGVGVDFIEDDGDRLFLYKMAVGKFSYTWSSEIDVDNILLPDIPAIIGVDPIGLPSLAPEEGDPAAVTSTPYPDTYAEDTYAPTAAPGPHPQSDELHHF